MMPFDEKIRGREEYICTIFQTVSWPTHKNDKYVVNLSCSMLCGGDRSSLPKRPFISIKYEFAIHPSYFLDVGSRVTAACACVYQKRWQ